MALNYSHRPVFPAHISEDNLVSPARIMNGYLVEGVPEKNGEGYSRAWHVGQGHSEEQNFNCGRDRADCRSSQESTPKDIVDLLPSDPFGMDIETTVTAITGWLEDLEVDCGGYMRNSNSMANQEVCGLFAEWNLVWNNPFTFYSFPCTGQLNEKLNMGVQSFPGNLNQNPYTSNSYYLSNVQLDGKLNAASMVNTYGEGRCVGGGLAPNEVGYRPASSGGNVVGLSNASGSGSASASSSSSSSSELRPGEKLEGAANSEGVPHEALAFALSYLGLKGLLSVERVCKSLCSTVRGDPLFWMTIHIDQPLNDRITDDVLVKLVSRAQGNLQCLSLVECSRITNDGLRHTLETNPRITKLSVPGCTKISIECIVNSIRAYNSSKDIGGIKHLRIAGLFGVNHEQFEELKLLLGVGNNKTESHLKPHFYHAENLYLPYDDERPIDIEMCPRCEKIKLVYDCPFEGCKVKDKSVQVCRACTLCIPRCAQCGRCMNDTEFEEMFCLELLCSDCFKKALKGQHMQYEKVDPIELYTG